MRLIPRSDDGSMLLAMLATIVTAGLIVVLVASTMQAQSTTRFDRSFTGVIQTADAGVQEAYYRLNNEHLSLEVGQTSAIFENEVNGERVRWQARRTSPRGFEVVSVGTAADGTERTVVAGIEQQSLFFPGAFGDRLVALNGTSTQIDSYESRTPPGQCPSPAVSDRCWGTDTDFGTRRGALGTNGNFNFAGNTKVLRAILYDWLANPGTGVTATNPGGSRCSGNPCTPEILRFQDEPLDYGSDEQMRFIEQKLASCGGTASHGTPRELGQAVWGGSHPNAPPAVIRPFSTAAADNRGSPADPGWNNYYCADSIQVLGNVHLHASASPATPVVVFVRDSYSQAGHRRVNCPDCPNQMNTQWRQVRPRAGALQIYVKTEAANQGANVMIAQHAVFAGVIYAPRATCGSSGNAGSHIYGSIICRNVDNVGNWRFHFDEALADFGRAIYSIATWSEDGTATLVEQP